jgi:hypothetical protein
MAQPLSHAIQYIEHAYILSAVVTISTTMSAKTTARCTSMVSAATVACKSAASDGTAVVHIPAAVAAVCISMIHVSAAGISTIDIRATGISTTIVLAYETATVKPAAVEIAGISLFKKRAVMGVVPIIPIVAIPGREIVIRIAGELVFIYYTIVAGVAIWVNIRALVI